MRRWRILVDARIEIIEVAATAMDAELRVIEALRNRDNPPDPLGELDWSEAYVVPGSAVDLGPATPGPRT